MDIIHSLAWSPNGCWLAACGNSRQIHIWDLNRQVIVKTLMARSSVARSLSWSPDSRLLACGQGDWQEYDQGHVQVWQAADGQVAWTATEPLYGAYSVCFAPNGRWLASGHGSGVTRIWHAVTGQRYITTAVRSDVRNLVNGICFSVDSRYVAYGTCYEDGLYVYGIDGTVKQELVFPKNASWVNFEHVIRFSPDGRWVARGSQAGLVSLWRVDDPLLSIDFAGLAAPTHTIAWSPDGRFIAGGSRLGHVKIWAAASETELITLTHRPLHTIAYSPNGHLLAGGGDDPAIAIWDVNPASDALGQCRQVLV